jgi:hypothetical protein
MSDILKLMGGSSDIWNFLGGRLDICRCNYQCIELVQSRISPFMDGLSPLANGLAYSRLNWSIHGWTKSSRKWTSLVGSRRRLDFPTPYWTSLVTIHWTIEAACKYLNNSWMDWMARLDRNRSLRRILFTDIEYPVLSFDEVDFELNLIVSN